MDHFVRNRVNQLTGLTVQTQKTGASTVIPADGVGWTSLNLAGITAPLTQHLIIKAYKLIADASDMEVRFIVDSSTKIHPFPDFVELLSGVDRYLDHNIQIPVGYTFEIQVRSATGGNANVDYLSVIEVDTLDNN
jgi:hypothetical protein